MEDYAQIRALSNVDYIVKDDVLLDQSIVLTNSKNISLYTKTSSINSLKGDVDVGRLPENDNEIVVEGYEDEYYMNELIKGLGNTTVSLMNMYTGETNEDISMNVVGIKYMELTSMYGNDNVYVSDKVLDQMRFQINQTYSKVKVLFQDKYYESNLYSPYFRIKTSENVPAGKAYVSDNLNYEVSSGSCRSKPIKIEVENIYYKEELDLTIEKTYTKYNLKRLIGKDEEYELNNGTIYINPEDYNKLFNKEPYQSSVFVKDAELLHETANELENLGYKTLVIKDTLSKTGSSQIIEVFQTIVTIILIITLFFIAYFVIKIILKSRNTYFATLRMLGATRKVSKQLLIIELLIVENLAYLVSMSVIILQAKQIINWSFVQTLLDYLNISDYIILYVILIAMSYIISLKYAKKLFKETSIKTYNEEV